MAEKIVESLKPGEIAVDGEKLRGILERLETLEERNKPKIAKPVNQKTCTVLLWEDKVVTGFGKFSKIRNEMGEEVLLIEVITEDGVMHKANYVEMLRDGARRTAFIKDIHVEIVEGEERDMRTNVPMTIEKKYVDNYRTVNTGVKVPVIIETMVREFTVELEETGQVIRLKEEVINV